ncbi:MAG: diacylglycerol kinase family protein [Candidatus Nanopelagicales bacterium]
MGDQMESAGAGRRRRGAAIVALITGALALIAVLALLLGHVAALLAGVLAAALAVTGGWYVLASRHLARILGGLVMIIGLALLAAAFVWAEGSPWALAVALGLGSASALLARRATQRHRQAMVAADLAPPRPPARHPVLIMNPKSGGGKVVKFDLVENCRARGIEPVVLAAGDDLVALAQDAVARGADVIGMAGGDGSQALVATVAMEHGIPHVVVPAGTRNHLALDLGLDRDDVVGALDAFTAGIPLTIDLATVNGRVFVNNASLGLYAEIVASQDYRDAKLHAALDALPDLLGENDDALDLHFVDDRGAAHDTADVVLVSNNPYVLDSLGGMGTRARMDTGELGVLCLTINSAADARRFLGLQAAGQIRRFPGWQEWSTPRFELDSGGPVRVGVDGEALTLQAPVVFAMLPGALTVLLPPHAPGRSPAARAMSGNLPRELWRIARGRG